MCCRTFSNNSYSQSPTVVAKVLVIESMYGNYITLMTCSQNKEAQQVGSRPSLRSHCKIWGSEPSCSTCGDTSDSPWQHLAIRKFMVPHAVVLQSWAVSQEQCLTFPLRAAVVSGFSDSSAMARDYTRFDMPAFATCAPCRQ